jgi:FkbM family methyltransferase
MRPLATRAIQIGELATDSDARRRWERNRFLKRARRFVPVLAVDDHRGNRYYINPADPFIGRYLFLYGQFEAGKLDDALRILADRGITPDRFIDIGANIGTTTIEFLSRFPSASAVAFEPDPANFALLSQNILANGLEGRAKIHQIALSDHDGHVEFERSPTNPGDHRVRVGSGPVDGELGERVRETTSVQARRLDSLCDEGVVALDPTTLVCIDVQGHESQVLDGASAVFSSGSPIVLEFWPYGLERARGYRRLLDLLQGCPDLFDITTSPARRLRHAELDTLRQTLPGPEDHAELLILPAPTPEY